MKIKTADIVIGDRIRKDYGDIEGLAASIRELGLLQPIGIRPDNTLVCGGRRILACESLGWTEIEATVCEGLDDEIRRFEAERDENTCRKQLTPAEAYNLAQTLEPKYAAVNAKAKQDGRKKGGNTGGKGRPKDSSVTNNHKANRDYSTTTRSQAAKATGYSAATLAKVKKVRDAADADDRYAELAKELEQEGCKVNAIYRRFVAMQPIPEPVAQQQSRRKSVAGNKSSLTLSGKKLADAVLTERAVAARIDIAAGFAFREVLAHYTMTERAYRSLCAVADCGHDELVQAVNSGVIEVGRAARIASNPEAIQAALDEACLKEARKVAPKLDPLNEPPSKRLLLLLERTWVDYTGATQNLKINSKAIPIRPDEHEQMVRLAKSVRSVVNSYLDKIETEAARCLPKTVGRKTS